MSSCEPYAFTICYVNLWLWRLVPLPLVIVGTVGNILNILVLCRRRLRKYSTTVYLIGIAAADILTLWSGVLPYAIYYVSGFPVHSYSSFLCKSLRFLSYLGGGYSVWLIILMTLERIILTVTPIGARSTLSVKNAMIFAGTTLLLSVLFSGHLLFSLQVKDVLMTTPVVNSNHSDNESDTVIITVSRCMPTDQFLIFYRTTWPVIVMLMFVMIPFCIIAIGNGVIFIALLLQKRRLRKVTPVANGTAVSSYNNRKSSTKILFLICTMFIITNLPYAINQLVSGKVSKNDPYTQATLTLVRTVTFLLMYCNYTFNFVLYFVSGTLFKQEWRRLVGDINRRLRKLVGQTGDQQTRVTAFTGDSSTLQERQRQTMTTPI